MVGAADVQDGFDILTGAWVAKKGGIPPLTDTRPVLMRSVSFKFSLLVKADMQMPYVFAFALTMILAALTLPRTSGQLPRLMSALKLTRRIINLLVLVPLARPRRLLRNLHLGQRE